MKTKKPITTDAKLDFLINEIKKLGVLEKQVKKMEERLEAVFVDGNTVKHEILKSSLTLKILDRKTDVIKIDVSELKDDVKYVKREIKGLTVMTKHLMENAVSLKEHKAPMHE